MGTRAPGTSGRPLKWRVRRPAPAVSWSGPPVFNEIISISIGPGPSRRAGRELLNSGAQRPPGCGARPSGRPAGGANSRLCHSGSSSVNYRARRLRAPMGFGRARRPGLPRRAKPNGKNKQTTNLHARRLISLSAIVLARRQLQNVNCEIRPRPVAGMQIACANRAVNSNCAPFDWPARLAQVCAPSAIRERSSRPSASQIWASLCPFGSPTCARRASARPVFYRLAVARPWPRAPGRPACLPPRPKSFRAPEMRRSAPICKWASHSTGIIDWARDASRAALF